MATADVANVFLNTGHPASRHSAVAEVSLLNHGRRHCHSDKSVHNCSEEWSSEEADKIRLADIAVVVATIVESYDPFPAFAAASYRGPFGILRFGSRGN